jgi:LmbE family N-acetylglucosaminyl deacetylase
VDARPKGWLLGDQPKGKEKIKPDVHINVKDFISLKYEALNKHVSQKGIPRMQTKPGEVVEDFITVIDNTK